MGDKTINEQVVEFRLNLINCISEGHGLVNFIDENHEGNNAERLKQEVLWELYGLDSNFNKVKVQQLVDDVAVAIKHENIRDKSVTRHYKRHFKHVNNKLSLLSEDEKSIKISDFYIDWLMGALKYAEMIKVKDIQATKENLKG